MYVVVLVAVCAVFTVGLVVLIVSDARRVKRDHEVMFRKLRANREEEFRVLGFGKEKEQ